MLFIALNFDLLQYITIKFNIFKKYPEKINFYFY